MLDQSFSAHNFEIIYNLENRKGHINVDDLPLEYRELRSRFKDIQTRINTIKKIAIAKRSSEEQIELEKLHIQRREIQLAQKDCLNQHLYSLANKFDLETPLVLSKFLYNDKEYFRVDTSSNRTMFFVMKQLQRNIYKTFKVKQSNRHSILTNIKTFLNSKIPVYVIRTDISGFYESIPQDKMLAMIENNTLLSVSSKRMIKEIIKAYETIKDTSLVDSGFGLPRGIGISAYLAEIYLRELDQQIRSQREVIFYARYVDDIFIILSTLPFKYLQEKKNLKALKEYYEQLRNTFQEKGLLLHEYSSGKCSLLCFHDATLFPNTPNVINYLGYDLHFECIGRRLQTTFRLTQKKKDKIRDRIDNAFVHFEKVSKYDLKQAIHDLKDSLNLISGNIRLNKAKAGVKVGLYYNNDLLDDANDFCECTTYLHDKELKAYDKLFKTQTEYENFIKKICRKIQKIDFKQRWVEKNMYKFSTKRLQEIEEWL